MKKFICILLALICVVILINASGFRVAQGEVTARTYIEEYDIMNTELATTDGEAWIAEDYTAPIGDTVFIIYDMCSRDTIYDDEIVYIIHLTSFR